jgi:hemoglobin
MNRPVPHPEAPGVALGIDESMIRRLVHAFYDEVRNDPALAPVFRTRIDDWAPHLETMVDFWSSVALMTGSYKGKPMQKHAGLNVRGTHFARWLALFEQTARRVCPPEPADFFVARAHMIAKSLQLGIGLVDPLRGEATQPPNEFAGTGQQ